MTKPFNGTIDLNLRDSFTGGEIGKVVFDLAGDQSLDVERRLAFRPARD